MVAILHPIRRYMLGIRYAGVLLASFTLAGMVAGCSAASEREASEDADIVTTRTAVNVTDIVNEPATSTMSIASTRPGVTAWDYKYSAHGFVVSARGDRPMSAAIALGTDANGAASITGVAASDATVTREALAAFLADAKKDYDAAFAAVPEVSGIGPRAGADTAACDQTTKLVYAGLLATELLAVGAVVVTGGWVVVLPTLAPIILVSTADMAGCLLR